MLSGSVFVISGAGTGLGAAVATELGRHGATVIVTDLGTSVFGERRSEKPATKTAAAVKAAGGVATVHCGDITLTSYARSALADTGERQRGR